MPIEIWTLDEIVELIADLKGVYGCAEAYDGHTDDCTCRICFTAEWRERILDAVHFYDKVTHAR